MLQKGQYCGAIKHDQVEEHFVCLLSDVLGPCKILLFSVCSQNLLVPPLSTQGSYLFCVVLSIPIAEETHVLPGWSKKVEVLAMPETK